MEDIGQKQCAECCSLINFDAKACPFCMTLQTKDAKRSIYLRIAIPMLIAFGLMAFAIRIPNRHYNRFADYAQKVKVVSSELRFETDEAGRKIPAVVGTIRNDSDVSWSDPRIEVQIFNAAGKLTDAKTEYEPRQTLSAHTEQAFKVKIDSFPATPDAASHKVFIRYAEDESRYRLW